MKLKQIASISTGYPFRGKISEVAGTGIVAVQMKDASPESGINWLSCIETELSGKRTPDLLHAGEILFAARGSNNCAVLVDLTIANTQAVASPHFYIISSKINNLLPEYLAWLLNQEPCQRYFQREAEGTLTKSIRRSVLENTPVAVPELSKQHAIISLAKTLKKEQQLIEQLIKNGESLMSTIANDLMNSN